MTKKEEIEKLKKEVELWHGRAESYYDAWNSVRENYERIIESKAMVIKELRTQIEKCTCHKNSA